MNNKCKSNGCQNPITTIKVPVINNAQCPKCLKRAEARIQAWREIKKKQHNQTFNTA